MLMWKETMTRVMGDHHISSYVTPRLGPLEKGEERNPEIWLFYRSILFLLHRSGGLRPPPLWLYNSG